MRLHHRHLTALALLLPLAACGFMEDGEDKLTNWSTGLEQARDCITVHGAALGASIGPISVAKVTPETAGLLQGMRDSAGALPLDDAGQPTLRDAYLRIADRLDKVKGQSTEVIGAMAESEPYQRDVDVLGSWYTAHCATDEQPSASDT
ncbi:hypothetical protein [Novilysobacter erysipheiresistens]|uniref:Lipoprotein n=1 Tax=Novilysobacter erysipheiresistens TaxID=1749332 RepID=A0ABU7YWT3_9GAMM